MNAAAVLLALASAVTWGTADFSGGFVSRRVPTIPVTVISQAAGFAALLVTVAVAGGGIDHRSFEIGILSGLGGGAGLAAFYKALSLGTMSIVSPITACGAIVPFAISIATGERPSGVAIAGAVLALGGAVLASAEERKAEAPEPRPGGRCSRPSQRSRSASSPTSSGSEAARAARSRRSPAHGSAR